MFGTDDIIGTQAPESHAGPRAKQPPGNLHIHRVDGVSQAARQHESLDPCPSCGGARTLLGEPIDGGALRLGLTCQDCGIVTGI